MSRSHKGLDHGMSALAVVAAMAGSPSPPRAGEPPASVADCDGPCTPYAIIAGSAFIGAGALVGAVGGALIKTERWEPVSLGRIGVSVLPRQRGAALALPVRF